MILSPADLHAIAREAPLPWLLGESQRLCRAGHGTVLTYSRKVFIPLTKLCRDVCGYCTFAETPRAGQAAYLSPDQVLAIARAGAEAGCHEALFTLGDKPELRYRAAREALDALGYDTTIAYLEAMCRLVLRETGLLPHVNPGVLTEVDIARLRAVSVSQGIMLESAAERLCAPGGVHHGSPDKHPAVRLETIRLAGEAAVPFTTGILIGIGETRAERIDALLAIRDLHAAHGHIQEIIVQNFRAKPDTRMAAAPEPDLDELLWTLAMARLTFGPAMAIQAPPNLSPDVYPRLVAAGLNDWGGISPVTRDHVNPEAPWPAIAALEAATQAEGRQLAPRLAIYPAYARDAAHWVDPALQPALRRAMDGDGFAREDGWAVGTRAAPPVLPRRQPGAATGRDATGVDAILDRAAAAEGLDEAAIVRLFRARGEEVPAVLAAADALRRQVVGDTVTWVVTRNINYTNVCGYKCRFCAFSKGKTHESLRGRPYDLDLEEIGRRAAEAWERGATEVCLQGGIHPDYTGQRYLDVCRAVREAAPGIHIHAFSPLEVSHGAATLGLPVATFLEKLQAAGLGSLPGTAAEILDDEIRAEICPDKLKTDEWLGVMAAAHGVGLRSTATIMFGHVETYAHWARHLMRIRALQARTGGFTELVPLPFVSMEAPMFLKGLARRGPTFREAVLMHAVARLALHGAIPNIQVSWVKMGVAGAAVALAGGVNDLGGTLMNESISRAAGTEHGQELAPAEMEALIRRLGRTPQLRTTLYRPAAAERRLAALAAAPLAPIVETPLAKHAHA